MQWPYGAEHLLKLAEADWQGEAKMQTTVPVEGKVGARHLMRLMERAFVAAPADMTGVVSSVQRFLYPEEEPQDLTRGGLGGAALYTLLHVRLKTSTS